MPCAVLDFGCTDFHIVGALKGSSCPLFRLRGVAGCSLHCLWYSLSSFLFVQEASSEVVRKGHTLAGSKCDSMARHPNIENPYGYKYQSENKLTIQLIIIQALLVVC